MGPVSELDMVGTRIMRHSLNLFGFSVRVFLSLLGFHFGEWAPTNSENIDDFDASPLVRHWLRPFSPPPSLFLSLPQEYSMDCYFRQYWRDSRLKFQGPMKSLSLSIKVIRLGWRIMYNQSFSVNLVFCTLLL